MTCKLIECIFTHGPPPLKKNSYRFADHLGMKRDLKSKNIDEPIYNQKEQRELIFKKDKLTETSGNVISCPKGDGPQDTVSQNLLTLPPPPLSPAPLPPYHPQQQQQPYH